MLFDWILTFHIGNWQHNFTYNVICWQNAKQSHQSQFPFQKYYLIYIQVRTLHNGGKQEIIVKV